MAETNVRAIKTHDTKCTREKEKQQAPWLFYGKDYNGAE